MTRDVTIWPLEDENFINLITKIKAYLELYSLSAEEVNFEIEDHKLVIKPKQEK